MLQGSLDDFTLDEVLGLLSSTSKSGRLRLSGDRGTGSLWLDSGELTAAEASHIPGKTGIEDVMFEMLRFDVGTFSFMVNEAPSDSLTPEQVGYVLEKAQERLTEWRLIESVVPSLTHMVNLVEDLPSEELLVNADEWRTILAVGNAAAVQAVCDKLELDEVDGSRRIMQMTERGLLGVAEPGPAEVANLLPTAEFAAPEPPMPGADTASVATLLNEADGRPPMPVPPSPSEIENFSSELESESPFSTGELLDESLVGAKEEGGSVLMKYLKGES